MIRSLNSRKIFLVKWLFRSHSSTHVANECRECPSDHISGENGVVKAVTGGAAPGVKILGP